MTREALIDQAVRNKTTMFMRFLANHPEKPACMAIFKPKNWKGEEAVNLLPGAVLLTGLEPFSDHTSIVTIRAKNSRNTLDSRSIWRPRRFESSRTATLAESQPSRLVVRVREEFRRLSQTEGKG